MTDDERMFWQMSAVGAMRGLLSATDEGSTIHTGKLATAAFDQADAMLAEMRERLALHAAKEGA